jgi:tRNA(Leu) C34 or U34 (ribose-2'-O)-methylase TrmL
MSICFSYDGHHKVMEYWSFVFENWGVKETYVKDKPEGSAHIYGDPTEITSYQELPKDRPLVIAAHQRAQYIQGSINLKDFEHPEDALYLFGYDHLNLDPEMFEGFDYQTVYIPAKAGEMYSFQAGNVFMYDRFLKNG